MPAAKPQLRAECVRLRVEQRMSFREIEAITGASRGSLSAWLKDHPLTATEAKARRPKPPTNFPKARGEESALHQTVKANGLSPNQKGKLAEACILTRMLAHGLIPFGSVFDGEAADWVVQVPGGSIKKVQVKLAFQARHGLPTVALRKSASKRPYRDGDFDILAGFDLYTDTAYVWTWDEIKHNTAAVTVSSDAGERWDKFRM